MKWSGCLSHVGRNLSVQRKIAIARLKNSYFKLETEEIWGAANLLTLSGRNARLTSSWPAAAIFSALSGCC